MKVKDLSIYIILGLQLVTLVFLFPRNNEIENTNYENEAKIQELEHQKKLKDIEIEYLHRLHFVEDADSTQLDSIWDVYGF